MGDYGPETAPENRAMETHSSMTRSTPPCPHRRQYLGPFPHGATGCKITVSFSDQSSLMHISNHSEDLLLARFHPQTLCSSSPNNSSQFENKLSPSWTGYCTEKGSYSRWVLKNHQGCCLLKISTRSIHWLWGILGLSELCSLHPHVLTATGHNCKCAHALT